MHPAAPLDNSAPVRAIGRRPGPTLLRTLRFAALWFSAACCLTTATASLAAPILAAGEPAQLDIRPAGERAIRITLKPIDYERELPPTPTLANRTYPPPVISLRELNRPVTAQVASLQIEVRPEPLTVCVSNADGKPIQELVFHDDGRMSFRLDDQPILGMGEGGPPLERDWRDAAVEFDRRGRLHRMRPRWQRGAYGSRNPVALLVGVSGWAMYVATPWGKIDLRDEGRGTFTPWQPPEKPIADEQASPELFNERQRRYIADVRGRPPVDEIVPGLYDIFIFDAAEPTQFMRDLAQITGVAAIPPRWSLGYMQSHRTLEDDRQLVDIVDTFCQKQLPLDAVIYLGTGFCPRGWNTPQPSLEFNPEVFHRDPADVIADLHDRHVKVVLHVVPPHRDRLPTFTGNIPPEPGETVDPSHILHYWRQHEPLLAAGVDAFWPDEGDWFNLPERIKRHQLYYQGPLSTRPNVRPWSLHRNGHLGIARWGGWVWSGDTDSAWKTLETQIAVGINHSLSLSPYWGSDIGGFFPNEELTGELYARWFQFGAFCPSFRSHGRTWWTRLPWGWGLKEMGPRESDRNPRPSELGNPTIEPICRKYAELRYQLLPYTYTLARQTHDTGLPLMRAMWLHYPHDPVARRLGSQYLWGRDLLVAPVFTQGATTRDVYLPPGDWYDYWTNEQVSGGRWITRAVDFATMPLYVRAGTILPIDPVRQYTDQPVDEPTTLKIYPGADGQFTLYEDDGISRDYLKGHATWTQFTWEDDTKKLIIESSPSNSATNPPIHRTFRIELVPTGCSQEVQYTGERIETTF